MDKGCTLDFIQLKNMLAQKGFSIVLKIHCAVYPNNYGIRANEHEDQLDKKAKAVF